MLRVQAFSTALVLGLVSVGIAFARPAGSTETRQQFEGTVTVLESPQHGPQFCYQIAASLPPQCSGLPVRGWNWNAVDGEQSAQGTTWGTWNVVGAYDRKGFTLTEVPTRPKTTQDPSHLDFSPACRKPVVVDALQGAAEWESLMAGDYGPFRVPGLVAGWASNPVGANGSTFVGNLIVRPGRRGEAVKRVRQHYSGALCVVERTEAPTEAQLAQVQAEAEDSAAQRAFGQVLSTAPDGRRGVVDVTIWAIDTRARAYAHRRWGDLVHLRSVFNPVR